VVMVLQALKFLERDGWISVTESVYIPTRVKFEANQQDLYRLQVENAAYDGLIKTILRSHGGASDDLVSIREYELAKRTGNQRFAIVDMLGYLQQMEFSCYLAQPDSSRLSFVRARIDSKRRHIDRV